MIKKDIIDYVTCSKCGKQVSNKTGKELVIQAWVECPECVQGITGQVIDMEVKTHKIFRWGNYAFSFSCKDDDDTLIEVAEKMPLKADYIPGIPILRTGMILKDEEGKEWEIAYMESAFFAPCRLKGASRFEPPNGLYSPYGWVVFQYKIQRVEAKK